MQRIDPHQPPADAALLDAQRACGRWLALRRLRLRLTSEQLAGMIDFSADQLRLLEAGMADAGFVHATARQRLSTFLKLGQENSSWLAEVIAVAAGDSQTVNPALIERVLDELDAIDTRAERDFALTIELIEPPQSEPAAVAADLALLEQAPAVFEVLRALVDADSYIYALWEAVHQQFKQIGIAEIGELIERMRESGLIEEAEQRLVPALDDEPLQFYRIAAGGRYTFNLERTRRARLTNERQSEPQTDPGADTATPLTNT